MLVFSFVSACVAQDITFEKSKYTSPKLKTEVDVSLMITDSKIYISGKKKKELGDLVIPFTAIDSMSLELAKRHRVAEGAGIMALSLGTGAVVMATKTRSYYLDIRYHEGNTKDLAVIRLDKTEYEAVISTLEARTGKKIEEVKAQESALNPTANSRNMDEVVPFNADAVRAALKPAMESFGCNVSKEKGNRVECKRRRGPSERNGCGGEMVSATLVAQGGQTHVKIETDKGFAGHACKKNWSTPIYIQMMKNLQQPAPTPAASP